MKTKFLLIFALLPFVQIIVKFDTDVSYMVILSAFLLLLLKRKSFQYWQVEFISISFLFSIILCFSLPISKALGPLILAILYVAYRTQYLDSRTLLFAAIVYCIFLLLSIIDIHLAMRIQNYLVGNIKWSFNAQRAFPILGTEAGLMAGVFIMLAELSIMSIQSNLLRYSIVLFFLFLALQTKSGSLIIFLLIFILNRKWSLKQVVLISGAIFLLFPLCVQIMEGSRVLELIQKMNDASNILFYDTSLAYRLSAFMGSIEVMGSNFLQFWGDKSDEMQTIYSNRYYSLNPYLDSVYHEVSSLGLLLRTGGIFSLFWLFYLLKVIGLSRSSLYLICTMAFSYSLFFPLSILIIAQKKILHVRNNRL